MIQSTLSGHERMAISYVSFISMAMAFGVLVFFSLPFFPFASSTMTSWIFFSPLKALFDFPSDISTYSRHFLPQDVVFIDLLRDITMKY